MKISLITIDGTQRHPVTVREYITPGATLADYVPPEGFKAVAYDPAYDALPVATVVSHDVPEIVTNAQFRRALIRSNIMPSSVLAAIEAMPAGATREEARTQWEYANTIERGNPLIGQLAPAFGLTSTQVDALFVLAATL